MPMRQSHTSWHNPMGRLARHAALTSPGKVTWLRCQSTWHLASRYRVRVLDQAKAITLTCVQALGRVSSAAPWGGRDY